MYLYVRVSVDHELILAMTYQPFKLGSRNVDEKNTLVKIPIIFYGLLTVIVKLRLNLKVNIYPSWCLSAGLVTGDWSQDFQIWNKMHRSTVRFSSEFLLDWSWSSVSFLVSNLFFFLPNLRILFVCIGLYIYFVRSSPANVPHPTWLHTYTDS